MKDKILDIILFVGGTFIIVYNLLYGGSWVPASVAIGVAMVVLGILRRNWKKNKDK